MADVRVGERAGVDFEFTTWYCTVELRARRPCRVGNRGTVGAVFPIHVGRVLRVHLTANVDAIGSCSISAEVDGSGHPRSFLAELVRSRGSCAQF